MEYLVVESGLVLGQAGTDLEELGEERKQVVLEEVVDIVLVGGEEVREEAQDDEQVVEGVGLNREGCQLEQTREETREVRVAFQVVVVLY
jgi:hypothetical protein